MIFNPPCPAPQLQDHPSRLTHGQGSCLAKPAAGSRATSLSLLHQLIFSKVGLALRFHREVWRSPLGSGVWGVHPLPGVSRAQHRLRLRLGR